jgi:hypothetical protein
VVARDEERSVRRLPKAAAPRPTVEPARQRGLPIVG